MVYDPADVRIVTADSDGEDSGFTFPVFVHKVVLHGGSDNATDVKIHAEKTVTGGPKIHLKTLAAVVEEEEFDPPVRLQRGMSVDVTGSGAIAYIYYTHGGSGGGGPAALTLSLAHFDGTDGALTANDEVQGTTWTLGTGAELDTAQKLFGTASVLATSASSAEIVMTGPASWVGGNHTMEVAFRTNAVDDGVSVRLRDAANNNFGRLTFNVDTDTIAFELLDANEDTVVFLEGTATMAVNTQYRAAVVVKGTTATLYFEGTRIDTDTMVGTPNPATDRVVLEGTGNPQAVWYDEFRLSRVARYSGASYTLAAAAFTLD